MTLCTRCTPCLVHVQHVRMTFGLDGQPGRRIARAISRQSANGPLTYRRGQQCPLGLTRTLRFMIPSSSPLRKLRQVRSLSLRDPLISDLCDRLEKVSARSPLTSELRLRASIRTPPRLHRLRRLAQRHRLILIRPPLRHRQTPEDPRLRSGPSLEVSQSIILTRSSD